MLESPLDIDVNIGSLEKIQGIVLFSFMLLIPKHDTSRLL